MNILFRAIITGFGLRLGSEVAKTIAAKVRGGDEDDDGEKADRDTEDDDLGSITPDPPQV